MPPKVPADLPQTDPPMLPRETLPTMYDLPSEDPTEPGLPDVFHYFQPQLLQETFRPPEYPPERIFAAGDLNLYYDVHHPLWHKRPDWFAVLDVPRLYGERDLRLSYVVWQEGVMPFIVVELLSPKTEKEDLGQTLREVNEPPGKWEVYERILRIPYCVVYNRYNGDLKAFSLSGGRYRELELAHGKLWLPELQLGLGLWSGVYRDIEHTWLRWYDKDEQWLSTADDRAEQEKQRAEQEKQRAGQVEQRAQAAESELARLRALLKEQGIED
jgi:Uma2 family endonuclease